MFTLSILSVSTVLNVRFLVWDICNDWKTSSVIYMYIGCPRKLLHVHNSTCRGERGKLGHLRPRFGHSSDSQGHILLVFLHRGALICCLRNGKWTKAKMQVWPSKPIFSKKYQLFQLTPVLGVSWDGIEMYIINITFWKNFLAEVFEKLSLINIKYHLWSINTHLKWSLLSTEASIPVPAHCPNLPHPDRPNLPQWII